MPVDLPFDAANPDLRSITIHRDFEFGSLAHLVMTDERLYRSVNLWQTHIDAGLAV
jgi:alkaline phosphatase D